MFVNTKHGKISSKELRAFNHEDEAKAKKRLEAHGWTFPPNYIYDDAKKIFIIKEE